MKRHCLDKPECSTHKRISTGILSELEGGPVGVIDMIGGMPDADLKANTAVQ
jgi:hypothetical protein